MKLFIAGLILMMTVGCASFKFSEQSPMLELVVRAASGRVLEENPRWVQPAYDITGEAIFAIETGVFAQLQDIDQYIIQKFPDSLTPEEQALAIVMIGALKEAIINDLDRRGITEPEEVTVRVVQVLTWINQTAAFRL